MLLSSTLNNLFFLFSFFCSALVHNPSLQPSCFSTTKPQLRKATEAVVVCGNCGCRGLGILLPTAIPGMQPHSGSGPQPTMWPPSVTETQRGKRRNFECVFIYRRTTKGSILLPCWENTPRSSNTARVESFFFVLTIETAALRLTIL